MKKRLFSFFLVIICVCAFSLSAFAKSIEDVTVDDFADIAKNPYLWYAQNQMLGVEKGTGVTLVCPNGDYKTLYTGGTLVTCPYDGEALVLADAGGVTVKKIPSGIGRKDLPGFEDEEGTAQVSKEGKLTYVAHPRLALNSNCVSVPYQDFFTDDEYHTDDCKRTGNHQSYCHHYQLSFNYNQYDYDYIVVDALRHTRTYATFNVVYEVQNGVPGTYYVAKGQPLFRYRKSLGADEQIFYSPKQETMKLPTDSARYDDYGISRYQAYDFSYTVYSAAKGEAIKARVFRLVVTCDPDDNKITNNNNITINKNTWNGNIYVDNSTNLTYIYPQYTTVNENNETVTNISENPIIYNSETKQYYTYDTVTNNYYYITYEPSATPTPSPSPSPSPAPTETPTPSESPAPTPTPDPGENPTPTSTPGGGTIITPGGDNPGSSSTPESGNKGDSGSSGWNPFKWLTDLLKDLV